MARSKSSFFPEGSYWLTRVLFLRCLGFLYVVAFTIALAQNKFLIGEKGLTPAVLYLARLMKSHGKADVWSLFLSNPTVFWLLSPTDTTLNMIAAAGCVLAISLIIKGSSNVPLMTLVWFLYLSIVNVGQTFYSFGWESQLLETGFLAIFLCPLVSTERFPKWTVAPLVCVFGYRWLLLRIMLGAGLIKLRGDECWRDLTCMRYHYETQPVPNPISPLLHATPDSFHKFEVLINHVVELALPWLLLFPRPFRQIGGLVQVLFQIVLIFSGNLSFLNWLTALPAFWCFDDKCLVFFFGKRNRLVFGTHDVEHAALAEANYSEVLELSQTMESIAKKEIPKTIYARRFTALGLTLLLARLSVPVVLNLVSVNQTMNTSFDLFRIINTYGAFGSITRARNEVILQGTSDTGKIGPHTQWKDLQFNCKPGDINRRPCIISPYHYRIDWQLWFASFRDYQSYPWLVHLVDKLLSGKDETYKLLAPDYPFADAPPAKIRAELYLYQYSYNPTYPSSSSSSSSSSDLQGGNDGWEVGRWWKRKRVKTYMPPIGLKNPTIEEYLRRHGLIPEKVNPRKLKQLNKAKSKSKQEEEEEEP